MVDPQHGEIGVRVVAEHGGLGLPPVGRGDAHELRLLDHMAVGEHEPVGRDDDASRKAGGQLRLVLGVAEKTQLASLRSLQGSEPVDKNFRIAVKRSAKFLNNLA